MFWKLYMSGLDIVLFCACISVTHKTIMFLFIVFSILFTKLHTSNYGKALHIYMYTYD